MRTAILCAGTLLAQAHACLASREDPDMLDLAPQVMDSEVNQDYPALHRAYYSKEADQCAKAYYDGDRKRGEALWIKLLFMVKNCQNIGGMIKQLHGRIVMISKDERQPKCSSICFYESILTATETAMGKDHRFVSDILQLVANYYEDTKQIKIAIPVREKQAAILKHRCGADSNELQGVLVNLAYDYFLIGRYTQAAALCNSCIAVCRKKKYDSNLRRASQLKEMIAKAASGKSKVGKQSGD